MANNFGSINIKIDDLLNSNKGSVEKLEAGIYDSVIVGAIERSVTDPITNNTRDVFEFVFQVKHESRLHYFRTKDFKLSLHEKSGYFDFLKKLLKVATPQDKDFRDKLVKTGIVNTEGSLTLPNHFGLSVSLTLDEVTAKNGKEYLQIISYKLSKNKVEISADAIPEGLLIWDPANVAVLAEGMTIKPRKVQEAVLETKPAPVAVAKVEEEDSETEDTWLK